MTTVILQFFTARREPWIGTLFAAASPPTDWQRGRVADAGRRCHASARRPGSGMADPVPGDWQPRRAGVSVPRPALGWNLRPESETGTRHAQAWGQACHGQHTVAWKGRRAGAAPLLPYSHDITERPEYMRPLPAGLRRYLSVYSLLQ